MAARPQAPPSPLRLLLVLTAALALAVPLASADHRQPKTPGGEVTAESWVRFDHVKGNEWWVEVRVTTGSEGRVDDVWARAEKGTYHQLRLQSWGAWAGSFHIPAGQRVQFFAMQAGGMSSVWEATSCFFTHPAGAEQCDPGSTDGFRATFRDVRGNEWWFQAAIDSNQPVAQAWLVVDTVDGGKWLPLKRQDWGAWTVSTPLPQGTTVGLFATNGPESVESWPCWRWTQASPIDCPPETPPGGPGAWMTRFDHAKGNEWWVEAKVGPIQPARVWAQDEGGPWVELTWRSWGAWAGSFHVEPGHKVRFQALVDGDPYTSCWFTHPQGLAPDGGQLCRSQENP
jgi:hypothetical protein